MLRGLLLGIILAPGLVLAAELPAAGPDPFSGAYLLKLTFSLLAVLALLFALLAVLRRFGGLPRAGRQKAITLQGSLAVGPRERVVWIEVAGHQLVLGVTSGRIEPLLHIPAAEAGKPPAEDGAQEGSAGPAEPSFGEVLEGLDVRSDVR